MPVVKALPTPVECPSTMVHVDAAVRGDREAASQLLGAVLPRIRSLSRYLSHKEADADDIAQDAAIKVLQGLHTYRGDGFFESWVDRIVTRTMLAAVRRRRRVDRMFVLLGGGKLLEPTPRLRSDEYMVQRHTIRALDQLPVEQRRVLVLHHVLEMSVPEVATELDVPVETVRSRLRLARQRLRLA